MHKKIIGSVIVAILLILVAAYFYLGPKLQTTENPSNNQAQTNSSLPSTTTGIIKSASSSLGNYLTDSHSRTLYTSSADKPGVSNCIDQCLVNWPPYPYDGKTDLSKMSGEIYKPLGKIQRNNGTWQYTYNNQPLYYYKGETKVGDTKGNGLNNGAWSIILLDQ
ncbi:MAG: hypothetical protein A2660_00800 [Candidatus Doudnabacteria bacterium RIFCSPHIGHO2_01_FULL_45_18]|uniref:Lipoprotein with Yx(FWY)xxD motif n=1 Tax=Candidatus Doudnabacteria bacterium RIFCSPHIGHO2_01_FULL_45_18 TaxID=1817823 RepID=A0A1F5NSP3_9BACT|nr:MAG: hypothetical protein A2660_00800 [Candidatus Doudnabacteria bacterium RIFCSPHIGHO2_01_FULL_45_18]